MRERGFSRIWLALSKRVARLTGDIATERMRYPLRDEWWQSLVPDLARIEVPMLECTSFSDANLHTVGSFRAFERTGSTERTAYTHRGGKWAVFYSDEARTAQRQFFDRHLKHDGSARLAPVRLEVRESRDVIAEVRDEQEWPLARTARTGLFLADRGRLVEDAPAPGQVGFPLRRSASSFVLPITSEPGLTGPMSLRVHVSLGRPGDAILFVGVEKWSGGESVPFEGSHGYGRDRIATGRQRASMRALDETASRPGAHSNRGIRSRGTSRPGTSGAGAGDARCTSAERPRRC